MTASTSPTSSGSSAEVDFVKKHDLRSHRKSPGNGDTLLLAAGELRGIGVLLGCKSNASEERAGACNRLIPLLAANAHWRFDDVADNGHMREQIEMLKDHADPSAQRIELLFGLADTPSRGCIDLITHRLATDPDTAPLERLEEIDAVQQGTFAGSGRTNHDDDVTGRHIEVYPTQHRLAAEALHQASDLKLRSHEGSETFAGVRWAYEIMLRGSVSRENY